jgi:hypothetical protein
MYTSATSGNTLSGKKYYLDPTQAALELDVKKQQGVLFSSRTQTRYSFQV